jgi:hypothetical protein
MVEKVDRVGSREEIFGGRTWLQDQTPTPLPSILDLAHIAPGCTIFSKIDLCKGYH